jgi:hypothetical protein
MVVRRRESGWSRVVDTGCWHRSHVERKERRRYRTVSFDGVDWVADRIVARTRDQMAGDAGFTSGAASSNRSHSASAVTAAVATTKPVHVC